MTVDLYTMDNCGYCERAKSLLKQRGVPFREIRLAYDDERAWREIETRSGMRTMPVIFFGERLIGGYRELAEQDSKDQLVSLKSG